MRGTRPLVGLLLGIAVLIAACSSVVNGAGHGAPGSPAPTASAPSLSVPTLTTPTLSAPTLSAPTGSLSSGQLSPPVFPSSPTGIPVSSSVIAMPTLPVSTAPAPSDADITDLHYRIPKGFVKGANYRQVHPLTPQYLAAYAVPRNERSGLDVLSIVLYRLQQKSPVGTVAEQRARIKAFNRIAHARRLGAITQTEVGGRLGFEESLFEKPSYRYVSWFVIGTKHLLQVSCQVGEQVHKVATACGRWVASIHFS